MRQPGIWSRWTLICFWVVHLPVTWTGVRYSVIYALNPGQPGYNLWSTLYYLLFIVCFGLELEEIKAYRLKTLRPLFYFISQGIKSFFCTWVLVSRTKNYRRHFSSSECILNILFEIATILPFYLALLYSVYVLYRQHRSKQITVRHGLTAISDPYNEHTSKHAAFLLPSRINSAREVIAETPLLFGLVSWIYTDPAWTAAWPGIFVNMLFRLRRVVGVVCIFVVLPFVDRLPGAPHNPSDTKRLHSWDYVKADVSIHSFENLVDRFLSLSTGRDEEAGSDIVRLNLLQPEPQNSHSPHLSQQDRELAPATRLLRPRYLCFLNDANDDKGVSKYTVRRVDTWLAEKNVRANPDYVFISYTRKHFYTQTLFDAKVSSSRVMALRAAAERDQSTLTEYATIAAREAGVSAFWIDFECVRPEDDKSEDPDMEDVYRICDIVRAAHSLTIVLGPPLDRESSHLNQNTSCRDEWIFEWGMRMWTVPEALLCPSEHRIAIYTVGTVNPEFVPKRNLASRVWKDADVLRQLIDHYEGSLHLTQLELISIALECLQRRQTDPHNAGDVAYVLMGLLRLRPKVNKADTDFQAFARLSLANDSNKILERIMCLWNQNGHGLWHDMHDFGHAKLWYLDPLYQIIDVGANNAVIIGDANGTVIDWNSLKAVDFNPGHNADKYRWSTIRMVTTVTIATFFIYVIMLTMFLPVVSKIAGFENDAFKSAKRYYVSIVGIMGAMSFVGTFFMPSWLHQHFKSQFFSTQARLFGMQGKADLEEIEKLIFGAACGRFKWSSDSLRAQDETQFGMEFTLIDTLSCTAILFRAERPPTLAFLGARERGSIRTLLCSYNRTASAFIKETVVRLDGSVLSRMPRLDSFRFAVAPTVYRDETPSRSSWNEDAIELPDIPEFLSLDD